MSKFAFLLGSVALVSTLAATGCAEVPEASEEQGATHSNLNDSTDDAPVCGAATPNPACNAPFFIVKAWELAKEEPISKTSATIALAGACLAGLATLGVITGVTDGAAPVVLNATGLGVLLGQAAGCEQTFKYLNQIGILDNLSCLLTPSTNSREVNDCECTIQCNGGVNYDGEQYYRPAKKFKYGFMSRGAAQCNCTDDTKAVACGWLCRDWADKDDASNCACND